MMAESAQPGPRILEGRETEMVTQESRHESREQGLCVFPGLQTGVGRGRRCQVDSQQAGLGAACTGFLGIFRRKARKKENSLNI